MVKYRLGEVAGRAQLAPLAAPSSKAGRAGVETGLFRRILAWFRHRQAKRRAVVALRALDDRLLNDIGIRRADIAAHVYGTGGRFHRAADRRATGA